MHADARRHARVALRADLLDFTDAPGWQPATMALDAATTTDGVRFRPAHWLLIDDGVIVSVQADDPPETFERIDHRGRLITPGLIDAHVHLPQLGVIASYGTRLLEWLERFTFPAEQAFADAEVASRAATEFLDALLAHGTTAAMVFPTVHRASVDALFTAAQARNMRIVAGKCLMDRNAPDGLRDDVANAERESRELIARWHGQGRARYAMTVRFAPTSTPAQLAMAARLLDQCPDVHFQTHLAENQEELAWVKTLFPEARSYLDVYAQAGLLRPRSMFAHGIWLDDADRRALAQAGATVAHCPSSNLFLGSGAMDWRAHDDAGVDVVLASDVGGGTSLSMVRTMADAYRVQAQRGHRLPAFKALHACTLGAARALHLADEIGSLAVGCKADVCIWDWACGPVPMQRDAMARDLHDRLFAWMMLGDERNLCETWVAGQSMYVR